MSLPQPRAPTSFQPGVNRVGWLSNIPTLSLIFRRPSRRPQYYTPLGHCLDLFLEPTASDHQLMVQGRPHLDSEALQVAARIVDVGDHLAIRLGELHQTPKAVVVVLGGVDLGAVFARSLGARGDSTIFTGKL